MSARRGNNAPQGAPVGLPLLALRLSERAPGAKSASVEIGGCLLTFSKSGKLVVKLNDSGERETLNPFSSLSLQGTNSRIDAPGGEGEPIGLESEEDEEPEPISVAQRTYLLAGAVARSDLLYIGPSSVILWNAPWTHGPQLGVYARQQIEPGTLVAAYTGAVYNSTEDYNAAHTAAERRLLNRYAIDVGGGIICPPMMAGAHAPDLRLHVAAGLNENSNGPPNCRMVSVILQSDQVYQTAPMTRSERESEYAAVLIYSCRRIMANRVRALFEQCIHWTQTFLKAHTHATTRQELTTFYGADYSSNRDGYTAQPACLLPRTTENVTALGLIPMETACVRIDGVSSSSSGSGSDPSWDGRS